MDWKSYHDEYHNFTLNNASPPGIQDGFEILPAGYITFSSFNDYKKIKNINKTISRFLERRKEIKSDKKVLKCLELIEFLIDGCYEMKYLYNDEYAFESAFPFIIKFI